MNELFTKMRMFDPHSGLYTEEYLAFCHRQREERWREDDERWHADNTPDCDDGREEEDDE